MISEELSEKIYREWKRTGESFAAIAGKYGLSRHAVKYHVRRKQLTDTGNTQPATEDQEEPVRHYIATQPVLLYVPAVVLHKGQEFGYKDTEDILKAVLSGDLLPAVITDEPDSVSEITAERSQNVCEHFERCFNLIGQSLYGSPGFNEDHLEIFTMWYRSAEDGSLSSEQIERIVRDHCGRTGKFIPR